MIKKMALRTLLVCVILSFAFSTAGAAVSVKEMGSFYVGGKKVVLEGLPVTDVQFVPGGPVQKNDPNGEYYAFQMYVQYTKLQKPKGKYPLVMWHGGGLSGVSWETTPDGRPGWSWLFLRAGNDVYVSDAVERGRATWARYPEINPGPPIFRIPKQAWELFRIGPTYDPDPAKRVKFENSQFPVDAFEQMMKQSTPRWVTSDKPTQEAYDEYVKLFNTGTVIMAHSQASQFAWNSAMTFPKNVKALVMVEPSAFPKADVDIAALKGIPVLFLYGDINTDLWKTIRGQGAQFKDRLAKQGNDVTWIEMPDKGAKGNTHMIMMDKNSAQVAQVIMDWMKRKKLMK